ncbi:2928_t:CDS:1, partial [Gigaspora rosea]
KNTTKKDVLKQINTFIQTSKYKIILIGDFNSTPNLKLDRYPPKKISLPESQLIKTLKPHFHDIY